MDFGLEEAEETMRIVMLHSLAAIFLLAGCDKGPDMGPSDPELDVIVSFLAQNYDESVRDHVSLVIEDMFSLDMVMMDVGSNRKLRHELLSQAGSKGVSVDLIKDFCAKNAKSGPVWPELRKRLGVVLVSQKEVELLFSAGFGEMPDGWKKFYAKYPKSPGIITISRVGLNSAGDRAMIYVGSQSHPKVGEWRIHVLRKEDGKLRC